MSFFDYSRTQAMATRLIARHGAPCTLQRHTGSAYDPATGTSTATYTELETTACVFDYPERYIDGTLIQAGDRQAFMVASVAPDVGDRFEWAGRLLTITNVKQIAPNGSTVVVYEANVRG